MIDIEAVEQLACRFELLKVIRLRAKWLKRRPGDFIPQRNRAFFFFVALFGRFVDQIVHDEAVSTPM